ncbi:hypothetical protein [Bisbaumannia pacifica]|uniref:Uncharacterized protein n=1 Tax=Bisbaumannia pacifica TaxID=77098 RepID=A0ABD4KXK6_9GAMM|nr:hypothetical protein [Halomonas pacifica]MBH8578798.1 hypothetical protein [Halomonas pacifica]
MDWTSAVDAIGSAAGTVANSASSGGLWDGVTNFATDAFNWIGDNPEAANLIGGVAMGVGQAYLQGEQAKSQQAFEREMYDRRRRDEMATPGQINGYSSHLNRIAGKGLLTSGMITGDQEDG